MSLLNLPEELLVIIIRLLDSKSMRNVYNTCKYIRQILCMHGVVKKFDMHKNTLATAHSLNLDFFKDISGHLQELNLCGMHDLKKSSLMTAMKKMKCLKCLDISYTDISIVDFLELYQLCPTIKNISLNFVFGKLGMTTISDTLIKQCQDIFKNFDQIHFVGSACNLLYSNLPVYVLSECNLKTLKFSASECNYAFSTNHTALNFEDLKQKLQFNYCKICILNWREKNKYHQNINSIPFFLDLDFGSYEFIIITMLNIHNYKVFISPLFKSFFCDNFNIEAEIMNDLEKPLFGNIVIMLWNKDLNKFDQSYFKKLYKEVKEYFPANFTLGKGPVSSKYNWYYTLPKIEANDDDNDDTSDIQGPHAPKRRMAYPTIVLDYDSLFKQKEKFMLTIIFHDHYRNAVSLSTNCDYLRKLTFFSLSGIVRYSSDFFTVLFTCCVNLETLNVEATALSPCAAPISQNIHLSKCLKNFRLVDKRIDFKTLVVSLSRCITLSNIHIVENTHLQLCPLGDPTQLLENCKKLYCLYIEAPMSESEQQKHIRLVNKTIVRCRKYYLNVQIQPKADSNRYRYYYDPFVDVFNLSAVKQSM